MNDFNNRFLKLGYLLGYFHQMWARTYDWSGHEIDFVPVVRYFKVDNNLNATIDAIADLQDLLGLGLDERELEEIIDEYTTSGYSPLATHRQFLECILEILQEPIEKTKQEFIPRYRSMS